jgi:hypothetical protein
LIEKKFHFFLFFTLWFLIEFFNQNLHHNLTLQISMLVDSLSLWTIPKAKEVFLKFERKFLRVESFESESVFVNYDI